MAESLYNCTFNQNFVDWGGILYWMDKTTYKGEKKQITPLHVVLGSSGD